MTTISIVEQQFAKASQYGQTAASAASSMASSLQSAVFSAPTINMSWTSPAGATPNAPTMPEGFNEAGVTWTAPSVPNAFTEAAPSITIDAIDVTIDDYAGSSAPSVNTGGMPATVTLDLTSVNSQIATANSNLPVLSNPSLPTLLTFNSVAMPNVDLHAGMLTRLDTIPELTLVEPTPYSYTPNPNYSSALLDALKAIILQRLQGGTGLSPAVEQAIWDRTRDRETATSLANEAEIQRASEALGFSLPSGVMAAQLRDAQKAYYDKLTEQSRDIAIKQAELEQQNMKDAINEGVQLESKLIDYATQVEQLAFQAAKTLAENSIQIYTAGVEAYKSLMQGYQTYAAAYETIIKGELAKVELFKGEISAEQMKADVNKALVEQYKAQIEVQVALVNRYQAQVGAAKTLVEIEQAKVQAYGEEVKGFVAKINGETAKVEAYKAEVQGYSAKVQGQGEKAKALGMKANAQAEAAKAEIARFQALAQAKTGEWQGYSARVQAEAARVESIYKGYSVQLDAYRAKSANDVAYAQALQAKWTAQLHDYEASRNFALTQEKMNREMLMDANKARLEAAKVGAQVNAQLAASAYNMAHAQAQLGYTYSESQPHKPI